MMIEVDRSWIDVADAVPAVGERVELLIGDAPDAEEGFWRGETRVVAAPIAGRPWLLPGAAGRPDRWVRYWRRLWTQ